jgi:hypothetical protein
MDSDQANTRRAGASSTHIEPIDIVDACLAWSTPNRRRREPSPGPVLAAERTFAYRAWMITVIDRPRSIIAGWSRRRRWLVAICLMVAFFVAACLAVPVVVFLDYTSRQGAALGTPVEATDTYLLQLNSGEEIGLSRALADDERQRLLKQWHGLLDEMRRTDPAPTKLAWSSFDTEDQADDKVTVTVPVAAEWRGSSGNGYKSAAHPWTFAVHREDGGWRLTAVTPYPWCGGYVDREHCR